MGATLVALAGTPTGAALATILALIAAVLHAVFGALQKGIHDPLLARIAIDLSYGLMAAPFALFVVPWPDPHLWPIFAGAAVIHIGYKWTAMLCYRRGAFTIVYPIMRGTGPLFAVLGASALFGETFEPLQWLGLAVLLAGLFGLSGVNMHLARSDRAQLVPALGLAVLTGLFVAAYTTYDAFGIRSASDPFTFLAWFFMIDGLIFPLVTFGAWRHLIPSVPLRPLAIRGMIGGLVGFASFGSLMVATRLDDVGEAAVLRETSTVFAAVIGWVLLGERVGPVRFAMMGLIAAGAVIVETTG